MSRYPTIVFTKGDKIGRLKIIRKISGPGNRYKCRCSCPNRTIIIVLAKLLNSGHTRSCGCLKSEVTIARNKARRIYPVGFTPKHKPVTHAYGIWGAIKDRCCNPNSKDWHNYGGRGIDICDEWLNSFEVFREYMMALPKCPKRFDELRGGGRRLPRTIDRYPDKNGNYEPGNVRWAKSKQQRHNSRQKLIWVKYNGIKIKLVRLCKKLGLDNVIVGQRLRTGWTLNQAIGKIRPPRSYVFHREKGWLNQSQAAHEANISRDLLHNRIRANWPIRKALGLSRKKFDRLFDISRY
jgi:hypothetical protein